MPSVIGFDSKETHREINGEDRIFPLGASIEVVNYEKFAEMYDKSMKCVWETLNEKRKRSIYSYQYFAQQYGLEKAQQLCFLFLKGISKSIINADVYFSNIPEEKTAEIYMYNNDRVKATKPTRDFLVSLVQPYSYMCAWKRCVLEQGNENIIFLDNFQGETTIAWQTLWYKKPNIFYKGDNCNALISAADILAGAVDNYLKERSFHDKTIDKILSKELKLHGKTYIIGSKDLRYIVPTSREPINTTRWLKHPIYYVIKEKRVEEQDYKDARNQVEYSPMFDKITNLAFKNNGAVKFYDETTDFRDLRQEDRLIYYGDRGRDLVKQLNNLGYTNKTFLYPNEEIE
ncbi:MAG: hypothetical protein QXL17_06400 [Candidatus Thermoplasmatota archaeon]